MNCFFLFLLLFLCPLCQSALPKSVFTPPATPPPPPVPVPRPPPPPPLPPTPKPKTKLTQQVLDPRTQVSSSWNNMWELPGRGMEWTGEKLVQAKDLTATALQTVADPVYLHGWWEDLMPAPWVGTLLIIMAGFAALAMVALFVWETYRIQQGKTD